MSTTKNKKVTPNKDSKVIEDLQNKNKEIEDKYLRVQAEFQNFMNRTNQELQTKLKYEGEELIKRFLGIVDNFERAIQMDDNDLSDEVSLFLKGFKMIYGNIMSIFEEFGIKEIDCLGKEFDPAVAEAVMVEENKEKPANVVLEVLTKGYIYKDKVIRPAMVKVNK